MCDAFKMLLDELTEEQITELVRVLQVARMAGFATAEITYKSGHPFSLRVTTEHLLSNVRARPGKRTPKKIVD